MPNMPYKMIFTVLATVFVLFSSPTPTFGQELILPDSWLTTTNSRLAPTPEYACVSGTWNQSDPLYQTTAEILSLKLISNHLPMKKYEVSQFVCLVAPGAGPRLNTCKYWKICLTQKFPNNAKLTYTLQLKVSTGGGLFQVYSRSFYNASFGDFVIHAGQSNTAFSVETYYLPLPGGTGTATSYNLTSLFLQEWRENNFYDIALLMVPSSGPSSGASTPQDRFPAATIGSGNWSRPGDPQYEFVLSKFGWHSFANCIEHAKLTSHGVHCLQLAVVTTRIESHMSQETYLSTGMKIRKPYTSPGTELLNPVGWFWNGQIIPIANSQPTVFHWLQGESNFANPQEYSTLLIAYIKSLKRLFTKGWSDSNTQVMLIGNNDDSYDSDDEDNDNESGSPYFVIYRLAPYCGGSSANPAYTGTTEAQTAITFAMKKRKVCMVTTRDLGQNTLRDAGLHWTGTKYHASVRGAECYAKYALENNDLITNAPRIRSALTKSYDSTTGKIQVELTFKTQKNPWSNQRLDITLTPTPACTLCLANNNTLFRYEQINSTGTTGSSFESWVTFPQFTFDKQTVTVEWIVPFPSFGRPNRLIYQPLTPDYFPQSSITNENTMPNLPTYKFTPLPSEPFSILI